MQCKNSQILIVGDQLENRQVLVNHLSQSNYDITQARNGEEALEAIKKGLKPDLILLALLHRAGNKVTRKIRKIWQADEVPILGLSERNQVEDWVSGLKSGVNDYLTQPLSPEELIFRINQQIELCRLKAGNQHFFHELEALKQENSDLKILLETFTEHGDTVANQLRKQADEAVQESERKLAQFLEAVPVGVGVLDANGKLYFLNQRAKEIFGKGVDPDAPMERLSEAYQVYIADTNQLYPSERLPIVRSLKGESVTADDLEVHQGDQRIPIEVWSTPIYDAEGNIAYSINALQDITERKRTEKLLADYNRTLEKQVADRTQELEQKNRQLKQEILASQIAAKARKQAEVALRQSEEKFAKAFRSCPSAFTITRQSDGCHIEVNESFCQFTGYTREEVIGRTAVELNLWVNWEDRTQLFHLLQKEGMIRNYEFNFRTKSGEVRTALLSAEMIDLDGQRYVISVSQDISDRQQAQAALQQAKEAAETANRAKSRFLANMSHELRTPLNAIIGFTQLLTRDSSLNSEQQDYIGIIQRSGEHLLELINNVLQMSKIEVGRITLNKNSFDLYHLLDSLEAMLQLPAQNKGLQLVFDRAPTLPQYIKTDESKLRQALINLLTNAIKFTSEGGVTLRVARKLQVERLKVEGSRDLPVERLYSPTGMLAKRHEVQTAQRDVDQVEGSQPFSNLQPVTLYFEVEDTGSGIAPEEMNSLFEPFVQTQTGRKSLEGTGLGLPITRQFVELMGGDIRVSSTLGKGSIFTFNIEVELAQELEIETTSTSPKVIGLESGQPDYRILVVDDRMESRLLLVKLLASVGLGVREAVNGQEAIDVWSSWEPHLIWMDMRMPVMDGYEATKRIKADLKGQATAIIALTASALEEERSIVLSAGCDDFVRKPFRESVIFEKMGQHLGVRYIYEQPTSSNSEGGRQNMDVEPGNASDSSGSAVQYILQPSSFQVMPSEWVNELYQAAVSIENERIFQLIEQIPPPHLPLAQAIADLVNNFRCDRILDLIEQARILKIGADPG
ncbi:response regulator [Allocoleopsis sp.]|uniref:response regulator n=1 Tax=Allocoleopsis sp. TaxID=3088169 RepID=UPI002FD23FF3